MAMRVREYLVYLGNKQETGTPCARQRAASSERAVAAVRKRHGLTGRKLLAVPASDATQMEISLADGNEDQNDR